MHQFFCAVKTQPKLHFSQNVNACILFSNQEDDIHVITLGRFGGTFYVMIAQKSAILFMLISIFYHASSWKAARTQHKTQKTQNTQQPTWAAIALPSSGFAIFPHGNICHGPTSWRRWSLWAHTRRTVSDALSLLFVPSFGVPKCNTSKIRECDVTSALGGHLLVGQHNNQPKVGVRSRRDIGEGARPGWNVWGGRHTIVWGSKLSNNKIK